MQEVIDLLCIFGISAGIAAIGALIMFVPTILKKGTRKIDICIGTYDSWKVTDGKETDWISSYLKKDEV